MQKTLLILSGGRESAKLTQRAKDMGFSTVVADSDLQAPAFAIADSCLIANACSAEEMVAAAERYHRKLRRIDGVLAATSESEEAAAGVIARLQLSGLSSVGVKPPSDRLALQRALSEAGLATPWRVAVETPQALRRVAIERGHDLILRPIEAHVQAGAQPVTSLEDMDRAFMLARQHSPSNHVIAEQRLEGPQIVVQAAVTGGACCIIAAADKIGGEASPSDECGFDFPSSLSDDMQQQIGDALTRACAALGYNTCLINSTISIQDNAPTVVTLNIGLAAELFWLRAIELSTGADLAGMAIELALGENVTPYDRKDRAAMPVTQRQLPAKRGRIARIEGESAARMAAGVEELQVFLKPGERVLASGEPRTAAAILATGASKHDATSNARDALAKLQIEMA